MYLSLIRAGLPPPPRVKPGGWDGPALRLRLHTELSEELSGALADCLQCAKESVLLRQFGSSIYIYIYSKFRKSLDRLYPTITNVDNGPLEDYLPFASFCT